VDYHNNKIKQPHYNGFVLVALSHFSSKKPTQASSHVLYANAKPFLPCNLEPIKYFVLDGSN